jgi:hypothetical protein
MRYFVFLFTALSLLPSVQKSAPLNKTDEAEVEGRVVDINNARVQETTLVFESEGKSQRTQTGPDGTYSVHLHPGVYSVSVSHWGFCKVRRAAFLADAGTTITLNFQLWVCPTDNTGKFNYLELVPEPETHLRPLVLFGETSMTNDSQAFSGAVLTQRYPVVLSYNLLSVRADSIIYSAKTNSIVATGNVVLEEGKNTTVAAKAEVAFRGSKAEVNVLK